ncbi:hypothetical protein HYV50_01965 [Candidatus Pacearchaeota archaeon]|nr:hypothetical protein [Candidatus Pacearchaeota archaeon]
MIRKIGTEKELEQKKQRMTIAIGLFMLGILVLGTAGFAFLSALSNNPNQNVNDNKNQNAEGQVRNVGNKWELIYQGQPYYFSNSPDSVKNISVEISFTSFDYSGKQFYIVSDNDAITSEIASTLGRYSSKIQKACYGPCSEDLPEKDCNETLIVWKDSSENKIYQQDSCVFIEGDMRAADAFLYRLFGI